MQHVPETTPARMQPEISRPAFTGRVWELAELALVVSRPAAVVLIEGEAGIGKSRLVHEFVRSRPETAPRVVRGVCPPYREPFSLAPVVDALRDDTDSIRGLPLTPLAGALRPMFPEWADELPPAPEPSPDATAARHRLFRAFAELMNALDVGILVIEDVHWADEATLEFLLFLTARRPNGGLAVMVTYRPEEVAADSLLLRLSSRVGTETNHLRLVLTGLGRDETASLASSMLDGKGVSSKFADFLYQCTEGVPLAVEELMRLLHARADLVHWDQGWMRRHLDDIDVPRSIRDTVVERLGRLEPHVQEVLRAAAVLSDPVDQATLTAVSGLSGGEVSDGLTIAIAFGWLQEVGRHQLSFRHVLTCRAVDETIPDPQRRVMHLRAGRALESQVPPPLVRLARHFREAGGLDSWREYAERAADQAVAVGDRMTATTLLNDLIGAAGGPPSLVARLACKLGDAALFRREDVDTLHGKVVDTLRGVLESAEFAPGDAAEVRERYGRLLLQLGEWEAGFGELERAIADLDHEPFEAAMAMAYLGWPLADPKPEQHLEWLKHAATLAERVRTPAERLRLDLTRATALLLLGEQTGWELADRLPTQSAKPDERLSIARASSNFGGAAILWGRYPDAERWLGIALELSRADDLHRTQSPALKNRARLDWYIGRWDRLTHLSSRAAGGEERFNPLDVEFDLIAGLLDFATGSWDSAADKLRFVVDEGLASGQADIPMSAAAGLAQLQLARGDVAAALELTDQPAAVLARSGIWIWATEIAQARVAALVRADRVNEATDLVTAFADGMKGCPAPAPRAALQACRALIAEARGDATSAAAAFQRAADAWDGLPRPYDASLARERQAAQLIASGQQPAGVEVLASAFERLSRLGARRDADRVAQTLRRHGVEVSRPWRGGRRGYGEALSPREMEVARLVADGLTNREIGQALFVSPKTVARHLNAAMRKLKVSSRTGVALRMAERDPSGPMA